MAKVIPFQGYRFNLKKIKDQSSVFVPPYDVISPVDLKKFQSKNPYNMVHLTLAGPQKKSNPYGHVNQRLRNWMKNEILLQDKEPSIYFYCMEFQSEPGMSFESKSKSSKKRLYGFISLVKLEDFESGIVIPHEITFPEPKADRLSLLESCHAHLEPVYALYEDKHQKIQYAIDKLIPQKKPQIQITDSNRTVHKFWKISHPKLHHLIESEMAKKSLLIADGHHRYEAALAFRDKIRKRNKSLFSEHPANFMMMLLVNMDDPGLVILPTHRMIRNLPKVSIQTLHKNLEKYFTLVPITDKKKNSIQAKLIQELTNSSPLTTVFGLYDGKYYLLKEKNRRKNASSLLDTDIFQELVIDKALEIPKEKSLHEYIGYTHSLKEAAEKVKSGEFQYSFILRPPDIHQIKLVCEHGRRLPQKSTYFYPKPMTGFVLYVFEEKKACFEI